MMSPEYIQQLRQVMEYEAARTAPPEGWPHMPDIPAGRYVNYTAPSGNIGAAPEFESQVRSAWQKLDSGRLPTAILERYRIGPDGDVNRAEVLVLYP